MNKWQDYYKIVHVATSVDDYFLIDDSEYQVIEIPSGRIIGRYKDFKYAKKQAKYKFKKLQAKLEKILLA